MNISEVIREYQLTTDGNPLVNTFEGFLSLDIARVNFDHPLSAFAHPLFPLVAVSLYLGSEPVVAKLRQVTGLSKDGAMFKTFVFVHNSILAVFSAWVAFNIWPIAVAYGSEHGYEKLLSDRALWNQGLGKWAWIFYVSKFYEFIDSWVLTLKGYKVSFLQKYHHGGIVLCMYAGCLAQANWLVFVVALNSFIHTLMYTYFAAATLGYKSPLAAMLTKAQLLQFLIGILVPLKLYWMDNVSSAVKGSYGCTQAYAVGLIYLFGQMYKKKYLAKSGGKGSKKDGVSVEVFMEPKKAK